jgi:TldD protein
MKSVLQSVVAARGAFLELRYHRRIMNTFATQKGRVEQSSHRTRAGVGVRALRDGVWGFATTSDLSPAAISAAADRAVVQAGELARSGAPRISPLPAVPLAHGDYLADGYDALLAQPVSEKLAMVVDLEKKIQAGSSRIHTASSRYNEIFEDKVIVTTDGAAASSRLVRAEVRAGAFAEKGGVQVAGTNSVGVTGGWACLFGHPRAVELAERTAREAVEQIDAPHVSGGMHTVILAPGMVGLLSHEAIGHTVEADFVLSGSVAQGKIGQVVGSELVSLLDSGADEFMPGAAGSMPFDDEGVPAGRTEIIRQGRLVSYLHNRETAAQFGVAPTGNGRAWEYADEPIIRMRNTYIAPGETSLDEMIATTDAGYLLDGPRGGQADATGEFMFGAGRVIEIRGGKLGRVCREVTLSGIAFALLQTVDAVSSEFRWDLGAGYCGKWQAAKVDAGGPYVRCRAMLGGRV